MWSKISSVLKSRAAQEDPEPSQADVMTKVFEQHPNLSVFHPEPAKNPSPPPSPSKSAKRSMFKRGSKAPLRDENDSIRAPSPLIGHPKKVKSNLNLASGNNSQASLSKASPETKSQSPTRRSSFDMLRPSSNESATRSATISAGTTLRRPSLDMLRSTNETPDSNARTAATISTGSPLRRPSLDMLRFTNDATPSPEPSPVTPSGFNSVRSILRGPKTPGTGQNVRFFSRDAYKVISPDQSIDNEFQPIAEHVEPEPTTSDIPTSTRAHRVRPSVTEVFSPMSSIDMDAQSQANFLNATNLLAPIPPPDFSDLFDMSQNLELPLMPPGLGFEIQEPVLENSLDISMTDDSNAERPASANAITSTPFRDKGKGKAKESPVEPPIDESIFHAQDKSARLPSLHDRSQSFSFGQTVFHSIVNGTGSGSAKSSPNTSAVFSSSDLKASLLEKDELLDPPLSAPPTSQHFSIKSGGLSLHEPVFKPMKRTAPEADINDESSQELVVYSGVAQEAPDPFRANATTYYTPQTMIPVTPPQGLPKHVRKASKEEGIIFSLQTQLALQTELCGQYETDLRARDELVEILGKKLGEVEKEDGKRKSVLRAWKKKVQELEKTCRYLEEEVEGSRQNSMERSVMDEASGEALRMLHRQIAVLEKEKADWGRKEELLKDEVATLEGLVKERSEDIMQLKEALWKRDESERELNRGIWEAKEQIEQLGNISCGVVDEEELKKLMVEKEMKNEQERERHRSAEDGWEEERAELVSQVQHLETDKLSLASALEQAKHEVKARDEEHAILKAELNAQWANTEKSTEKTAALEGQITDLEKERDALKANIAELMEKVVSLDAEWAECDNRKVELENELEEVWNHKDELEKDREQLEDQLQQEREHSEELTRALQEREDRISELDQERQFAQENLTRLEEKLHQRDEEVNEYSQRVVQRETDAEQLREEMSNLRREHTHAMNEQTRALEEASLREAEARTQLENLVRQQATADVELKSSADKINALKEEVERLRRKIQVLQQESADKDIKLVQLNKQRQRDKEDLEGLNTALDSKQMELELIKRNMGVRGTGGATPAPASRVANPRRDSAIFSTPTVSRPPSRPASVLSDNGSTVSSTGGKERKRRGSSDAPPVASANKLAALGKSVRVNGPSASTTASASKRVEGSMGPPPMKARASLASSSTSTPTPAPRAPSLTRSSSVKPAATPTPTAPPQRRLSSLEQMTPQARLKALRPVNASPPSSVAEQDEKENVDLSSRRRSAIPIPG
ncbi:hypothetical protein H0H81_004462 [Sphagnurus paluster]|uniref:Uncharacterized protein n=1 Tax=Sphagnurus paluster TaxID=117069 RepID=A0A9P7GTC7_9AGAR|nr:hypothetical protein H0H81_004462 [Sphagnurus paluster]